MGLDQYLYAKNYVSPTFPRDENSEQNFQALVDTLGVSSFIHDDLPSINVEVKVAYWRKANQIHQWFVDNVQDGEDNCAEYYVAREQLKELVELCRQTIADHEAAEELLPTSSGFFFGSTEYDEYYFADIQDTVTMLEKCLANVPDNYSFYYWASW